jgi:hypothetical protein
VKIVIEALGVGAGQFIISWRARAAVLDNADVFERDQAFFHRVSLPCMGGK